MEYFVSESGQRLDVFVANCLGIERTRARTWILDGCVKIETLSIKPSFLLATGMCVQIEPPPPLKPQADPENIFIERIYEDDALVVVNKPAGMATHPGPGNWHGGVVNALLYHCQGWTGIHGEASPGVVQRLDKPTTGLLVYAKHEKAHKKLLEMMRQRQIHRRYWAICQGSLTGAGTVTAPLRPDPQDHQRIEIHPEGQNAVTHWTTLAQSGALSAVELVLETGRTHQIRVHMASLGCPVWGDGKYGEAAPFMALHSVKLCFTHPITGIPLEFSAPPPHEWRKFEEIYPTLLARI